MKSLHSCSSFKFDNCNLKVWVCTVCSDLLDFYGLNSNGKLSEKESAVEQAGQNSTISYFAAGELQLSLYPSAF